ncbi:MAG: dihydropyrimidinase [Eubacteriales bacterium]|nr:dihydropyrimidinase [Eubacteriales bacterium]
MILLKNGKLVSSEEIVKKDVLINEETGKIEKISNNIKEKSNYKINDISGKYLFAGFIDAHTHFDLSVANTTTIDDFYSGTKAAIRGGTTTIIDYASQYKNETLKEALNNWKKKASKGTFCDYSFHMSISDISKNQLEECKKMIREGITSFKLYMTYDVALNDKDLFLALCAIYDEGGIAGIHCENAGIIEAFKMAIGQDKNDLKLPYCHMISRPPEVEAEALNRVMYMAKILDAPIIAVHTTCRESLDEIRRMREKGVLVYVETCPQYLTFDTDMFNIRNQNFDEISKYICAPPIREKEDVEALWDAIKDGEIDTIATDHCAFTLEQKRMGKEDYRKIPGGMNLVEYRAEIIYDEGVHKKNIDLQTMSELLSENPADIYGLSDRKGYIEEGYDADLVVFNTHKKRKLSVKTQISKSDYCAYEGRVVNGIVEDVYLRGKEVVKDTKVLDEPQGTFIKRKKTYFFND